MGGGGNGLYHRGGRQGEYLQTQSLSPPVNLRLQRSHPGGKEVSFSLPCQPRLGTAPGQRRGKEERKGQEVSPLADIGITVSEPGGVSRPRSCALPRVHGSSGIFQVLAGGFWFGGGGGMYGPELTNHYQHHESASHLESLTHLSSRGG